jgi:hypothetical protein
MAHTNEGPAISGQPHRGIASRLGSNTEQDSQVSCRAKRRTRRKRRNSLCTTKADTVQQSGRQGCRLYRNDTVLRLYQVLLPDLRSSQPRSEIEPCFQGTAGAWGLQAFAGQSRFYVGPGLFRTRSPDRASGAPWVLHV